MNNFGLCNLFGQLAGFENLADISVNPIDVTLQQSKTFRIWQVVPDHDWLLRAVAIREWYFIDGIQLRVHPVYVMSLHINSQISWVANILSHNGGSVLSVQPITHKLGELSVVEPVDVFLDGVDGDLAWVVGCRAVDYLSVRSV